MTLSAAYHRLRASLAPLGIEIGPDVLNIWLDRVQHGGEPMPETALRDLAAWAASQASAGQHTGERDHSPKQAS